MFWNKKNNHKEEEDNYRHLREGELYIGSDGHHHHYHANRHRDSSERLKKQISRRRKLRKKAQRVGYATLWILAIVVLCYVLYLYAGAE